MPRGHRLPNKITVLPPEVVPISEENYQAAVSALARMIGQWWDHEHRSENPLTTQPSPSRRLDRADVDMPGVQHAN